MVPGSPISLPALLDALEERWDALGPTGVRQRLVEHARSLAPAQRADLLAVFEPAVVGGPAPAADETGELLDRIDELVGRVAATMPTTDSEVTGETDELLRLLGDAFLAGERQVAVEGYERLLDLEVDLVERPGQPVPGGRASADLLAEAFGRLLWLDATDPARTVRQRAARVVAHHDRYAPVAKGLGAEAVLDAHRDRPDDETVTAVAVLLATSASPSRFSGRGELAAALAHAAGGTDLVAELARRADATEPLALYRWLVDHEQRHGTPAAALRWAGEALDGLGDSPGLARLADIAAHLHRTSGRSTGLRSARQASTRAWHAHPTAWRLAWALADAGAEPAPGPAGRAWTLAVRRLRLPPEGPAPSLRAPEDGPAVPVPAALDVALDVLAGDLAAVADLGPPPPTAALDGLAAERLAVAALCAVAGGADLPAVVAAVESIAPAAGRSALDGLLPDPPRSLASWLLAAVRARPADAGWLAAARELTDQSVTFVLARRRSELYPAAAGLVALVAAAHDAAAPGTGAEVLDDFANRYGASGRFRAALDHALHPVW